MVWTLTKTASCLLLATSNEHTSPKRQAHAFQSQKTVTLIIIVQDTAYSRPMEANVPSFRWCAMAWVLTGVSKSLASPYFQTWKECHHVSVLQMRSRSVSSSVAQCNFAHIALHFTIQTEPFLQLNCTLIPLKECHVDWSTPIS